MKIKSLLLTLLLAIFCVGLLPRQAEARVTFSYFYDSLQPYGDWVDVDNYGYCWQPRGLDPDWRPYTDGYWAYTEAGWTWVSYEDFGSITYHYGRWIRLEDFGWVWKPDYQWGPAWVSWRQSDDYIGWAPLPPEVDFNVDSGIGVWVDRDYDIGPSAYSFCEYRNFGAPALRNFILPWRRNVIIINSTVNITNITYVTGDDRRHFVFNGGPDYRRMSDRTEHRIEMLQLMRQTDGDWARHPRPELSRQVGGQLFINAPEVDAPRQRFAPPKVAREIHTPRIDKGWMGISDNRERDRIKQRYQDQTRGLDRRSAPASPVDVQAVQATVNEARALRDQGREQRDQMTDQQRKAAEFSAKAARAQQLLQTQQQAQQPQTAAEPQRQAGESNTRRTRQDNVQQQPQAQQPQVSAEQQRQAAEVSARAARVQQEAAQRQQQAGAEQQRQAAEVNARAARAQQEAAQREQQAGAEQQRKAAEFTAKAARAQQEMQAKQQEAAAEQQRKAAEFSAKAARVQQEAAQRVQQATEHAKDAQSSPTPDDHKKKHQDRDN
jgi:hypothetical protein